MFTALMLAAALQAAPTTPQLHFLPELPQGPMPYAERTWSMPHPNSTDRMFPDMAIKDMRVDGDTLYVELANIGGGDVRVPILVAARAVANGTRSDVAEIRTSRMAARETRWVAIRGFSIKTAAAAPSVFALDNATTVSAVVRLMPSSAGMLDRTGDGCHQCTTESNEANNTLTLSGSALTHGRP
jgi:hypothetical protein